MRPERIAHVLTAEEAFWLDPCERWELIEGRIVALSPVRSRHGRILSRLTRRREDCVERHGLGEVVAGDVGFILQRDPDTVRAPDLAFTRKSRLPAEEAETFSTVVPDLAIEILSPSDRFADVERKVSEFLTAGAAVVWVIDPASRKAHVYRAGQAPEIVGVAGALEDPSLLPGLRVPLAELL
jgi:Uma2 family endonuclease